MRLVTALALAAFAGSVTVATAQPQRGKVFVGIGALAAMEKVGGAEASIFPAQEDASGTAPGGTLGLGVHLTEHVTARVEASLTDRLTTESDYLGLLAGSALGEFTGFVPTLPGARIIDQRFNTTRETAAVFTLLGYHLRAKRASIELLGGLGLLRQTVTSSYEVRYSAPPSVFLPPSSRSESTNRWHHAVAVVGADVAVSMTTHASLVPHVRAYVVNNTLNVRPGLSLRWTF